MNIKDTEEKYPMEKPEPKKDTTDYGAFDDPGGGDNVCISCE